MIESTLHDWGLMLTFNRPERRNALTNAMYQALTQALREAQENKLCNAVILRGAQGHFTAGNDLGEFQAGRGSQDSPALGFLRTLADIDVPVIAAVEGRAVGVGVTLLQHCDFVYAGETALFSMPFVTLGLCPEGGSSLLMVQRVGARRAAEWLLLGKSFSAQEAGASGFITSVCPAGEALDRAIETARDLSDLPGEALRASKRLMQEPVRESLHASFDRERDAFRERLASPEAQAAFRAFFERKR